MPTPWITTSDGAFALAGVPASARRQTTTATANRPFLTPLPKAIPWEKASVHPIGDPNPLFRFALWRSPMNGNEATLVWADEYSRMAQAYDRVVTPKFEPLARALVELLDPKPGEMILDISTGTGLLAYLVAPLVKPQAVVAIDLADEAIGVASYRAGK